MRVTTQMVNQSARKAGLPINQNSLLNYINKDDAGSSLLNSVSSSANSTINKVTKNNYEKLEKVSGKLQEQASLLAATGEDSVFEQAKSSGDHTTVVSGIEKLVDTYNDTLSELKKGSGVLNSFYLQQLKELITNNADALKEAGITQAKDGSLSIDTAVLKSTDIDTLEDLFGNKGTLSNKLAFVAGKIQDNAAANIESISNQYTASGSLSSSSTNKYDLWG